MTTFNVLDNRHRIIGTYPEYTKFARYKAPCGIIWIPLLVGENKVQSFALSTLRLVEAQPITQEAIDALYTELYERHTVTAVDMGYEFTVAPLRTFEQRIIDMVAQLETDIHVTAMAFILDASKTQTKRMSERKIYTIDLYARIQQAINEPPPRELVLLPDYDMPWQPYPAPIVLTLTPEQAANVNHAIGVEIKVAA